MANGELKQRAFHCFSDFPWREIPREALNWYLVCGYYHLLSFSFVSKTANSDSWQLLAIFLQVGSGTFHEAQFKVFKNKAWTQTVRMNMNKKSRLHKMVREVARNYSYKTYRKLRSNFQNLKKVKNRSEIPESGSCEANHLRNFFFECHPYAIRTTYYDINHDSLIRW